MKIIFLIGIGVLIGALITGLVHLEIKSGGLSDGVSYGFGLMAALMFMYKFIK